MTTEVTPTTETQQTQSAPKAPTISDPELSFAEYEMLRRGEELPPKAKAEQSAPGATAPEQKKEAGATEASATDGKEETEEESETEAKADDPETESEDIEKPKKKGGFQRRIDKLNAQKTAAQQELEYWKKMALERAGTDSRTDAPKGQSTNQGTTPKAEDKPNTEKFETHAEYVEALSDWKVDQKLKERDAKQEQARAQSEQTKLQQSYQERLVQFADKHDDFYDVILALDSVPRSGAVESLILRSENGPELLYELGKNPKEAYRIATLPPLDAAREIGRLESKLQKPSEAKAEPKKLTQAPKPIEPVSGTQTKVSKSLDDPDLSFSDYVKLRREQQKRRRA